MLSMQWTGCWCFFYFLPSHKSSQFICLAIKLANQCIIEPLISIRGAYQTWPRCPPVQSVHKRWQTQLLHFTDVSWLRPYNGQTAAPPASTSFDDESTFCPKESHQPLTPERRSQVIVTHLIRNQDFVASVSTRTLGTSKSYATFITTKIRPFRKI